VLELRTTTSHCGHDEMDLEKVVSVMVLAEEVDRLKLFISKTVMNMVWRLLELKLIDKEK
jgi:hypothetical protein